MTNHAMAEALDTLAKALRPDETLDAEQAARAAISKDGTVYPEAVAAALGWHRVDWYFATLSVGSRRDAEFVLPQGATVRRVEARAKTVPTSSELIADIVTSAGAVSRVSIPRGQARAANNESIAIPAGAVLTLNVVSSGGAAGVTISVFYSLIGSGASGGSGSQPTPTPGGGAVDSVNGQTGAVVLTTDNISEGATNKYMSAAQAAKLDGIEAGAEANVRADWNATSGDAAILNKPSAFPAEPHAHVVTDVSGLQVALDGKADIPHGHAIADVTNLQATLNSKADTPHAHTIADVTNLQSALDGKADDSHTHSEYEGTIAAGTTSQYWRGDKSWRTLNRAAVGLGNVDNTSDANKPISTAQQAALNAKADVQHTHTKNQITDFGHTHSKNEITDFAHTHGVEDIDASGVPSSSTYLRGDGTWAAASSGGSGPADTDALPEGTTNLYHTDARVSANADVSANTSARHTHSNQSTLDATTAAYTAAEKSKLAGVAAGAEVNVNADWNANSGDAAILNKPSAFPPAPHTHGWAEVTGKPSTYPPAPHDHDSAYAAKSHETATNNPHGVTKAQVGLGSVDNTSDANKPVSTAHRAAIDAVKSYPFTAQFNTLQSTTQTTDYVYIGSASIDVPPGRYRVTGMAVVPIRRSVGTGEAYTVMRIGGSNGSEGAVALSGAGIGANVWFSSVNQIDITITTTGNVTLQWGYRGGSTAGTTQIMRGAMYGTLTPV